MENSLKLLKRESSSNEALSKKIFTPDKAKSLKFTLFYGSVNGRSKESIAKARMRLKYYRSLYVNKKTAAAEGRIFKIRRQLIFGSFKKILKSFRKLDFSNEFIHEVLPFMRKVTFLQYITLRATTTRNKKLDTFKFYGRILRKYFRLKLLKRCSLEGDIKIASGKEFNMLSRAITIERNLNILTLDMPPESLIDLAQHKEIIKDSPHRFRRLPHFSHYVIPNLTDAKIKENTIRFYSKLFSGSGIQFLKANFGRNNFESQIVFLHLAAQSPKLHRLLLELHLNKSYAISVQNQVAVSLKESKSLDFLSIVLKTSYETSFVGILKGISTLMNLRVLELTLDKEEYDKDEIEHIIHCLGQLTGLKELTLVLTCRLWRNLDESNLNRICETISRRNLINLNLRLNCEYSTDLMSSLEKKKYFTNLCQLLPMFLQGLQSDLTGLSVTLQLEYFEDYQITSNVLQRMILSMAKMNKLNKLTFKAMGFPRQNEYPNIVQIMKHLNLVNDLYLHLDFLNEEALSGLLQKLPSWKKLKRLYLGSDYLYLDDAKLLTLYKFAKSQRGLLKKKFSFKCKNPNGIKILEKIR